MVGYNDLLICGHQAVFGARTSDPRIYSVLMNKATAAETTHMCRAVATFTLDFSRSWLGRFALSRSRGYLGNVNGMSGYLPQW